MSNDKTNSEVKIERFERNLRVKLTDKEVAERANRAAHLVAECDQKDEEREAANKHAKAQLAELEAEMRKVSTEVRDGATYRGVTCERRYIYRTGTVQEVRTDTGDTLSERAMTDMERQMGLDLDDDSEPPPAQTEKKKRSRKPRAQAQEEADAE